MYFFYFCEKTNKKVSSWQELSHLGSLPETVYFLGWPKSGEKFDWSIPKTDLADIFSF